MRPRIAIPVPTTADQQYNELNWPAYAEAVELCGGTAVRIALEADQSRLSALANSCDGVLLPGSPADVAPERYGQQPEDLTAAADPAREGVDIVLLEHAWGSGKPLLAVCFGMQVMNVWRGGTLIQDLSPLPVNHAAGRAVSVAHAATVHRESQLGRLIADDWMIVGEGQQKLLINSSHHQAVGLPGAGVRIIGRSVEDGVVEAIEISEGPPLFLGVQWHPERTVATSAVSHALFRVLIEAAFAFSEQRVVRARVRGDA